MPYLLSFLKYFIDCLHFLCFCPFRLKLQYPDGRGFTHLQFKKGGWWIQKGFYFVGIILAVLCCVKDIRFSDIKGSKNPKQHFQIVYKITILASIIYFAVLLWSKANNLVKVANFLLNSNEHFLPSPSRKLMFQFIATFTVLTFMYLGNGFITLFIGNYSSYAESTGSQWWLTMADEGRSMLFLHSLNGTASHSKGFFGTVGILGVYYRYGLQQFLCRCSKAIFFKVPDYPRRMSLLFGRVFLLVVSFTFWAVVKTFIETFPLSNLKQSFTVLKFQKIGKKQDSLSTRFHFKDEYLSILKLTRMLNPLIGTLHGLNLVADVFYYGTSLARLTDWKTFKEDFCYLSMSVAIILVAASGDNQVPSSFQFCHL